MTRSRAGKYQKPANPNKRSGSGQARSMFDPFLSSSGRAQKGLNSNKNHHKSLTGNRGNGGGKKKGGLW